MPTRDAFEYAVVRVVPQVEREEFVNAGVIVHCYAQGVLLARVALDEARLRALAPGVDVATVRAHLDAVPRVCAGGEAAGPIGLLSQRERWHWLTAPRSTVIQTSTAHAGLCDDPAAALERLFARVVATPSG